MAVPALAVAALAAVALAAAALGAAAASADSQAAIAAVACDAAWWDLLLSAWHELLPAVVAQLCGHDCEIADLNCTAVAILILSDGVEAHMISHWAILCSRFYFQLHAYLTNDSSHIFQAASNCTYNNRSKQSKLDE